MRCFLLLILSLLSTTTYAADLTGQARIVDGDTIWIGGTKVRLHGIDAPETRQECLGRDGASYRCGEASTDSLRILVSTPEQNYTTGRSKNTPLGVMQDLVLQVVPVVHRRAPRCFV